jgi:hypothetical protein
LERSLDEGIGTGLIGVMATASQKRTGMICRAACGMDLMGIGDKGKGRASHMRRTNRKEKKLAIVHVSAEKSDPKNRIGYQTIQGEILNRPSVNQSMTWKI